MGVKLNKETSDVIHVSQMKDGQIAEIVKHACPTDIGRIVQRSLHDLITIGMNSGKKYSGIFECDLDVNNFKVRILKNGETLTITDNE